MTSARVKWCPKCHHTLEEHDAIDGCQHGSGDGIVKDAPDRCDCSLCSEHMMVHWAAAHCITLVWETR